MRKGFLNRGGGGADNNWNSPMDVFGQIFHFTPLFIADVVEILPNMYVSSDIMLSSTF
jgi:hypothetical protein